MEYKNVIFSVVKHLLSDNGNFSFHISSPDRSQNDLANATRYGATHKKKTLLLSGAKISKRETGRIFNRKSTESVRAKK